MATRRTRSVRTDVISVERNGIVEVTAPVSIRQCFLLHKSVWWTRTLRFVSTDSKHNVALSSIDMFNYSIASFKFECVSSSSTGVNKDMSETTILISGTWPGSIRFTKLHVHTKINHVLWPIWWQILIIIIDALIIIKSQITRKPIRSLFPVNL